MEVGFLQHHLEDLRVLLLEQVLYYRVDVVLANFVPVPLEFVQRLPQGVLEFLRVDHVVDHQLLVDDQLVDDLRDVVLVGLLQFFLPVQHEKV